jgi:hypothetical protein
MLKWVEHCSYRLSAFEKRVLRRIFEPKTEEITGALRKVTSAIICTLHQILGLSDPRGWDGRST